MKVLILAGGMGTRLGEETVYKPKPMVEIGGYPILWHIMKIYSHYGFNEFVILTGYKSHMIKDYFIHYYQRYSDVTVDMTTNSVKLHKMRTEPWKVTMLYTGQNAMTGSRIKKAQEYVGNERFMLTYGDAVGNINLNELLAFHKKHGKIGTISVYNFGQNKGVLDVQPNGKVNAFREKSDLDGDLINIGFMVMNPEIFDRISGDDTVFEQEPLNSLVQDGNLIAYTHRGYWQCMDTLREKQQLEKLWTEGNAPWKGWED